MGRHNRHYQYSHVCITARNEKVLQQASLLANNPRSTQILHTLPYKRVCPIPDVTSCNVRTAMY